MKLFEVMNIKTLYMPIAPSGAGKSTYLRKLRAQNPNIQTFSLDDLRHEWYDPKDYARAWKLSTEDKEFANKANQRFVEMVRSDIDIYVDNTNLTPKRRKFYLQLAKKHGYKTVGIVFDVPIETLIARQSTRGDKHVPEEAVRRQAAAFTRPYPGEFDEIIEV